MKIVFLFFINCLVLHIYSGISDDVNKRVTDHFSGSAHTNNWAVLVCTSRFWFNYRHVANALSI
uniref:GIY-YIG domain-containing protein n=1 Tax=Ciona savignyi TaxID=51511 RepID=H2Y7H5_CIOSA